MWNALMNFLGNPWVFCFIMLIAPWIWVFTHFGKSKHKSDDPIGTFLKMEAKAREKALKKAEKERLREEKRKNRQTVSSNG